MAALPCDHLSELARLEWTGCIVGDAELVEAIVALYDLAQEKPKIDLI